MSTLGRRVQDLGRTALIPFFRTDLCIADAYHQAQAGVSRSGWLLWRLLAELPELKVRRILPGTLQPLHLGSVATTLWLANARDLPRLRAKLPWLSRRSRRHLGYWYFELDRLPSEEAQAAALLSEVWVASRFVAGAVRRSCELPVHVIPPPVLLEAAPEPAPRRGPLNRFLVSLDAYSSVERKNPWAAVEAFRRVFRGRPEKSLTVRVSRPEGLSPELRQRLEAEGCDRVRIHFETFPQAEDARRFMAGHDVYLSPHRCEGLGLHLVEAIQLGLPVVATGYGGNTDFCDPSGVDLIAFDLVPGVDPQGLYTGAFVWAQPRLDHFCSLLEALDRREPEELEGRSRAARRAVAEHFDSARIRRLLLDRLSSGGREVPG